MPNRWVQIDGPPSLDVLETVRKRFGIDPLALEDIVNQGQRPKFNEYENGFFLALALPPKTGDGPYRQLSMYATDDALLTFMEQEDGIFDQLEDRLSRVGGRLRKRDVYFLMHAVIDSGGRSAVPADRSDRAVPGRPRDRDHGRTERKAPPPDTRVPQPAPGDAENRLGDARSGERGAPAFRGDFERRAAAVPRGRLRPHRERDRPDRDTARHRDQPDRRISRSSAIA